MQNVNKDFACLHPRSINVWNKLKIKDEMSGLGQSGFWSRGAIYKALNITQLLTWSELFIAHCLCHKHYYPKIMLYDSSQLHWTEQ